MVKKATDINERTQKLPYRISFSPQTGRVFSRFGALFHFCTLPAKIDTMNRVADAVMTRSEEARDKVNIYSKAKVHKHDENRLFLAS